MLDFLDDLLSRARRAGADAADAVIVESRSIDASYRMGNLEHLERSESQDLGLRVLIGRRQAMVSSSDRSPAILGELVERAVAMARATPEDPYCGLAPEDLIAHTPPALDIADPAEPSVETLMERARTAEQAALAVKGVTNSGGSSSAWGRGQVWLAATNGFAGTYQRSSQSVSVSALAGEGTGMERDFDWSAAVYESDLADPAAVGRTAGERAVRRLNPRKVETAKVPVVFEQRIAGGLVRSVAGAIDGAAIARGTSFLKDRMGERILSPGLTIVDDPLLPRAFGSRPFDGEGLPAHRLEMVADGVLQSWFLDLRSARQLGLSSTGHAARGTSSPPGPSPTNLDLLPGASSLAGLIGAIRHGFLVTELIGHGVNLLTGDYSRGAAGFWIENGEIAYPVSEVTIAGRLQDMLVHMTPADDLVRRSSVNAPTVRVDGMTVAGR